MVSAEVEAMDVFRDLAVEVIPYHKNGQFDVETIFGFRNYMVDELKTKYKESKDPEAFIAQLQTSLLVIKLLFKSSKKATEQ